MRQNLDGRWLRIYFRKTQSCTDIKRALDTLRIREECLWDARARGQKVHRQLSDLRLVLWELIVECQILSRRSVDCHNPGDTHGWATPRQMPAWIFDVGDCAFDVVLANRRAVSSRWLRKA